MENILIIKNQDYILISQSGKRLIIDKNNKDFDIVKNKTIEEIKQWYLSDRK